MLLRFTPADGKPVGDGFTLLIITPDLKRRYRGGPLQGTRDYFPDEWILQRAHVPALSDEDWYATPAGWTRQGGDDATA